MSEPETETGGEFDGGHHSESNDSGFSDIASSTESVGSSIYNHKKAHGRTYHAYHPGKYYLPNDTKEVEQMEILYDALRLVLNGEHYLAPVKDPMNILDVDTGSGMWCIDVAEYYPSCMVKGIDLSPIQPLFVPPNCVFEVADVDDEWTFKDKFDLIHTRCMHGYTLKSWPTFFKQAYDNLQPGGWLEMQELDHRCRSDDNSIPSDSCFKTWGDEWVRAMEKVGQVGYCEPETVMHQMEEAGFVNVICRTLKLPIGKWPKDPRLKDAGILCMGQLLEGLYGLSAKCFMDVLRYSLAELEAFLAQWRIDIRRRETHAYWPVFIIYGQKPQSRRQ